MRGIIWNFNKHIIENNNIRLMIIKNIKDKFQHQYQYQNRNQNQYQYQNPNQKKIKIKSLIRKNKL